ncbi:MAG: TolC family protein [Planctomycetes bacterium]|nr:TolC family protein [Planctomycetota bacterium]
MDVLLRQAGRLHLLGRRDEQRAALDEAVALADETGDEALRSKARRSLGALLFALSEYDAAQEALRLSEMNLKAGAMTTLDVLQAQDAATQARLRYAASVVHYNQSQVNLLAALGLLNEGTLTTTPYSDGTEAESSSTEG